MTCQNNIPGFCTWQCQFILPLEVLGTYPLPLSASR